MKTDGIILDIDGTLWNSTPIVAEAWNEIIEKRDDIPFRFTAKQLTQLFGRPLPVIADMVFPFLEEKERHDLMNAASASMNFSAHPRRTSFTRAWQRP